MPSSPSYRGRFAPSPTGPLHFGSLVAAFGSWLLARAAQGQWWVRVEDLDPPREVAGAAALQLAALEAHGLRADAPVQWQSQRGDLYQAALDRLLQEGKAFECHCSRTDLAASGGIHHLCVARAPRPDPAIRLRVPEGTVVSFQDGLQGTITQDLWKETGDFVLKRADGPWAYQLAVVVDDHAQGMTDIVRGADLLESTPRQIHLQHALGLPTPRYLHLPLVLDDQGQKLSKSDAAPSLALRTPLWSLRAAWGVLGQSAEALQGAASVTELLACATLAFQPDRLPACTATRVAALHNIAGANAV